MTILGLSLAYTLNYFLGKYGWYKILTKFGLSQALQKAEDQFQKYGYKAIYISYWMPNFASLISTGAGILKAPFKKFMVTSTIATILWSTFWGITAYILGQKILSYFGGIFFIVMAIWILSIIVNHYELFKKKTV